MRSILTDHRFNSFKYLFYILVLINSIPILIFPCFHTLDGPSHLYNVNLLKEIIIEKNAFITQFFSVKQEIIPNWSSHLILLLFRMFCSSYIANKLLLLIITIGLPLSIFLIIRKIAPQNQLLSVFSLPFVYTFLFGLGFYNYCLGLVVFFLTLNFWICIRDKLSLFRVFGLFLLMSVGYFTHIFIFVLVFFSLLVYSLSKASGAFFGQTLNIRKVSFEFLILILVGLPLVILLVKYLIVRGGANSVEKLPLRELIKWILDVRPLIIYSYTGELKFARVVFFLATGFILYSVIKYLLDSGIPKLGLLLNHRGTPFLFLTLVFVILYFTYPNTPRSGGSYISIRILIFVYLAGFLWLSTLDYPKLIKILGFSIILVVNFGLLYRYHEVQSWLNLTTKKFNAGIELIDENSVILPIRNSDNWLDLHYPNYLGIDKPLIILENYEATTNYFPIEWNINELPSVRIGDSIVTDVCLYNRFPAKSENIVQIDYILTWGDNEPDACKQGLMILLEGKYELVYTAEEPSISLFKLKL